jgi:hypothetical protein
MAILAISTGDMTAAQYEALRKEVNWEVISQPAACFMPRVSTMRAGFTWRMYGNPLRR